jgi:hypothetical protein
LRPQSIIANCVSERAASGSTSTSTARELGHADIGTTINLYGHLDELFLREAAARAKPASSA